MTIDDLRDLLREMILGRVAEISGSGPHAGLELRPESAEQLLIAQRENSGAFHTMR